jgi:hypothetical protein
MYKYIILYIYVCVCIYIYSEGIINFRTAAIGFLACGVPVKKATPSWPHSAESADAEDSEFPSKASGWKEGPF